tara:strand:- start:81 stop:410 length:330 start_codon:yes stop_codon:yes gene_type:complete
MILETVKTVNGKRAITRVRTSVILIVGFSVIPLGIYLLIAYEMLFWLTLILFFAPCFILYPLIRFFISGGKDSVAAVVATVVVEEVTKATIMNQVKKLDKNYSKNEKKY